jgi:hypothetical protein
MALLRNRALLGCRTFFVFFVFWRALAGSRAFLGCRTFFFSFLRGLAVLGVTWQLAAGSDCGGNGSMAAAEHTG